MRKKDNFNKRPMKAPRVAMYIKSFPPFTIVGGTERQCKIFSEELVKKDIDVFIVTEQKIGITKSFEIMNGVPVYRIGSLVWLRKLPSYINRKRERFGGYEEGHASPNRLSVIRLIFRLITHHLPNCYFFISSLWFFYRKRNDFDIIHIYGMHVIASFGTKIAQLLNKKSIVVEQSSGDGMTFWKAPLLSRKKILEADIFIAISNRILSDLVSLGIPKEKTRYIPHGVKIEGRKWQFDFSKERFVACVGSLDQQPRKGLDILIESWQILVQRYNKICPLQICGRGNPESLKQLVIQFGIEGFISFPGFVDNARQHLLDSCLFILPSRVEGLSNALLEAMSLGLPCVATDVSGSQDLIQSGINGLLVPSEDPEALAKAVLFMLDNPDKAKEIGYNARKTIERQYAISGIADKYIELYKELVDR